MACTREGNVSFKKQCQDREQLILTIFNMLTGQSSEKIDVRAARERQERPEASRNNEKGRAGMGKTFIKFENMKLVFLEAHPIVGSYRNVVRGEKSCLFFISHIPDHKQTEMVF